MILSIIIIILPVTQKVVCLSEQLTLFHPVLYFVFVTTAQLEPYLGSPGSQLLTGSSFSETYMQQSTTGKNVVKGNKM